jgi:hypothetical protein
MSNRRSDVGLKAPIGYSNRLGKESPTAMGARRRTYGSQLRRIPSGPSTFLDALDQLQAAFDAIDARLDALCQQQRKE